MGFLKKQREEDDDDYDYEETCFESRLSLSFGRLLIEKSGKYVLEINFHNVS